VTAQNNNEPNSVTMSINAKNLNNNHFTSN